MPKLPISLVNELTTLKLPEKAFPGVKFFGRLNLQPWVFRCVRNPLETKPSSLAEVNV